MPNKKRYILKAIVVVFAITVIAIVLRIYYAGSLMPDCNEGVFKYVQSPDKEWMAEEVFGVCGGAAGVTYTQVKLRKESDRRTVVFDLDLIDTSKLDVRWEDSEHLVISYPKTAPVESQKLSLDDVTIGYVVR